MLYSEAVRSRDALLPERESENFFVLARAVSYSACCDVRSELHCLLREKRAYWDNIVSYFRDREENLVRIINESFDIVLCDSERVRVLSVNAGMSAEICKTCYPGTAFYRKPLPIHKPSNDTPLKLAYIGVANLKFKGLEFLISALEECEMLFCRSFTY